MLRRVLILCVATLVLWYLGHILLESVWTLARLPEVSPARQTVRLVLVPVALAVAWLLLPHRRS